LLQARWLTKAPSNPTPLPPQAASTFDIPFLLLQLHSPSYRPAVNGSPGSLCFPAPSGSENHSIRRASLPPNSPVEAQFSSLIFQARDVLLLGSRGDVIESRGRGFLVLVRGPPQPPAGLFPTCLRFAPARNVELNGLRTGGPPDSCF